VLDVYDQGHKRAIAVRFTVAEGLAQFQQEKLSAFSFYWSAGEAWKMRGGQMLCLDGERVEGAVERVDRGVN
jgi:hypothetical protein